VTYESIMFIPLFVETDQLVQKLKGEAQTYSQHLNLISVIMLLKI
jgi:hypothetical protein